MKLLTRGVSVKTLSTVYASTHKNQKINFVKVPKNTVGTFRRCGVNDYGVEWHIIDFCVEDKHYMAFLAATMFEVV